MATKSKKTATKETDAKVVRITATGGKKASPKAAAAQSEKAKAPAKVVTKKPTSTNTKTSTTTKKSSEAPKDKKNIFSAIGGYFAGAWYELKQVQWPNRRATWSLTGAMLVYTAFFVVLILLLDTLFRYIFEGMLG